MNKNNFLGKWYISEMEMWDKNYIDAETKGYILFNSNSSGEFQFGYIHGFLNCQYIKKNENYTVKFIWEGNDECDNASGRGHCKIVNNKIYGNIIIDNRDNSDFTAIRQIT